VNLNVSDPIGFEGLKSRKVPSELKPAWDELLTRLEKFRRHIYAQLRRDVEADVATTYKFIQLDRVTVDNTAGGRTLVGLGVAFNPNMKKLSLQNIGLIDIFVASVGNATAASFQLPAFGAIDLPLDLDSARGLRFYATANCNLNVMQRGDE
jgi:hypothetical protein